MAITEELVPATVTALEKDLRNLWKEMAEKSQKDNQQAVMRACVLNLLVFASGERALDEITAIMADVSIEHPARNMIMMRDSTQKQPDLQAWVTALCHFQPGGRRQVCCEQIVFRVGSDNASLLPGAVRPLIVPEIPVVLWWRQPLDLNDPLFSEFLESASRAIIDSSSIISPMKDLARYVSKERQWTAFSDLNWAKLTPRRVLISGFFDVPDCRSYLDKIQRVEISYNGKEAQAMLLGGWIASRLQWKPEGGITAADSARRLLLKANNRRVTVEWRPEKADIEGVVRVRIYLESTDGYFQVSVTENGEHLITESTLAGLPSASSMAVRHPWNETQLIHRELEILGHDRVYEDALIFFADL
jgi:glucose-6-phosphate dehydrogenase assembly protein OpcA